MRRAGRGLRCVEQSRKPKTDLAEGSWWTWGEQCHSGDGDESRIQWIVEEKGRDKVVMGNVDKFLKKSAAKRK